MSFFDYSGRNNNCDDAVQYFVDKFLSKRQIYYHVRIQKMLDACKEIVLRQNIKNSVLPKKSVIIIVML